MAKDGENPSVRFTLVRDGVLHQDYAQLPLRIEKRFTLDDAAGTITAEYELTNKSDRGMPVWFGIEFNVTLLAACGYHHFRRYSSARGRVAPRQPLRPRRQGCLYFAKGDRGKLEIARHC